MINIILHSKTGDIVKSLPSKFCPLNGQICKFNDILYEVNINFEPIEILLNGEHIINIHLFEISQKPKELITDA